MPPVASEPALQWVSTTAPVGTQRAARAPRWRRTWRDPRPRSPWLPPRAAALRRRASGTARCGHRQHAVEGPAQVDRGRTGGARGAAGAIHPLPHGGGGPSPGSRAQRHPHGGRDPDERRPRTRKVADRIGDLRHRAQRRGTALRPGAATGRAPPAPPGSMPPSLESSCPKIGEPGHRGAIKFPAWPTRPSSSTWRDGMARVTINRPDKLNALNAAVIRELGEAAEPSRAMRRSAA